MSALRAFERDVIARIIASHPGRLQYRQQLEVVSVAQREDLGEAVFVTLSIPDSAPAFPAGSNTVGTLRIAHPDLVELAMANLFVSEEGFLDVLEFSLMEPWPADESKFAIFPGAEPYIFDLARIVR